jgi:hypothetical protein
MDAASAGQRRGVAWHAGKHDEHAPKPGRGGHDNKGDAAMPRVSKDDAPIVVDVPEIQIRQIDLHDYTVTFNTVKADSDPAPLFRGLPNDRCQCPHWGTVLSGKVVYRFADHDETYTAGDAYYAGPGHLPLSYAGTETIEFSPAAELRETLAVVGRNMQMAAQT